MSTWEYEIENLGFDKTLSKPAKIEALKNYLQRPDIPAIPVLNHLLAFDVDETFAAAYAAYTDPKRKRVEKLEIGSFLLTMGYRSESFASDFAQFLVHRIRRGGLDEFLKPLDEDKVTPIGEYVFWTAGRRARLPDDVNELKDPRVVPILIKALSAPDNVFTHRCVCERKGEPGKTTGENRARELIPVVLERLGVPKERYERKVKRKPSAAATDAGSPR